MLALGQKKGFLKRFQNLDIIDTIAGTSNTNFVEPTSSGRLMLNEHR
jgi:hypothetical protein